MTQAVVTGSSGLLGRHVATALVEAGHSVVGVDAAPPPDGAAWHHVAADLTRIGAALQLVRDCDVVVHCAAIPRPTGHAAEEVFRVNVTAAYNVVEAAVQNGAARIVYASSMSVLGYPFFVKPITPAYLPIDAAHPHAPQDAYALSKWLGEEILDAAVRRSHIAAVSLRMPWIQTAESFAHDIMERRQHADLAARDLWAYLDARDAGTAFLAAVEQPVTGHLRLYVSAADTFMETETGIIVAAAYPDAEIRRPLVGHETVFDLSEAQQALGFKPSHSWRDY